MEGASTDLETLVLGLDGACFRILTPLFDSGELPTLESIFTSGASGRLESQIPPWTPSAWPSLYTGTNPGKHGVFGFLNFSGYQWDVFNASHIKERTLWEYVDYHGRSSVVVNAPVTYPPPEINGAVVPGYMAPENPSCHPSGLLSELKAAIGDYRVYAALESVENASIPDRIEEYQTLAKMRGDAFRYLVDQFNPAFGFLQFQHTDTVLHEFPEDLDAVAAVYSMVDDEIKSILEECDPDTVIVVSDHGLGPYSKRVRVNEVLRDAGIVTAVRGGEGMPNWSTIRDDQLANGQEGRRGDRGWMERTLSAGASVGLTAQRVRAVLDRLGLGDFVENHIPSTVIRAASEQVDFPNSTAYVRSRVECGVRINLEGREPNGTVPPEKYDEVRDEIITLLSDLETPDGTPVFTDVSPREAYFHGPNVEQAVDVVTVPNDFNYYMTTWLMDTHFADAEPPGWDHKLNGVIAATGAGVDTGSAFTDAHLFDVAPTVLESLDIPPGDRMDGDSLSVVPASEYRSYPERESADEVTVNDEDMKTHLENLGYLE